MPLMVYIHYRCEDCGHVYTVTMSDCLVLPIPGLMRCPECDSANIASTDWKEPKDDDKGASKISKTNFKL